MLATAIAIYTVDTVIRCMHKTPEVFFFLSLKKNAPLKAKALCSLGCMTAHVQWPNVV